MAHKKITDLDPLNLTDLRDEHEIMISQDNITYKTTIGALRANISGNIDQRIRTIENAKEFRPAYSKSAYIFHNDEKKFYPDINEVNKNITYKIVRNQNNGIDTVTFTNNSNKGYMINVLYRERIVNKDYVFKNWIRIDQKKDSWGNPVGPAEELLEIPVFSTKAIYKTKVALLGNKNSITFNIDRSFASLQATDKWGSNPTRLSTNNNQFSAELTDL